MGFSKNDLAAFAPESRTGTPLGDLARDPAVLQRAIQNWSGAGKHFVVTLTPEEIKTKVAAKLQSLPAGERAYWQGVTVQDWR